MNKFISKVLFLLPFAFALVMPTSAFADTASVQAQIQTLLAQIAQLQAQLGQQSSSTSSFCHTFNTNIKIGDVGTEVSALQTALSKEFPNQKVYTSGTFDESTAGVVSQFQEKYARDILTSAGLNAGTGYVGASTRAKLNSLYGCGSPAVTESANTSPGTTVSNPIIPTTNSSPSISIISPNGGEQVTAGQSYIIRWTSTNLGSDSVNLALADGGGVELTNTPSQYIEQGVVAPVGPTGSGKYLTYPGLGSMNNVGYFSWTVPATIAPGGSYYLCITQNRVSGVSDCSNAPFRIVAPTVSAPSQPLTVTPNFLSFSVQAGNINSPSSPQQITLSRDISNYAYTSVTTSDGNKWLIVTTPADGPVNALSVSIVPSNAPGGLTSGVYHGIISIIANDGTTVKIPVTLTVGTTPSSAPVISGVQGYPGYTNGTAVAGQTLVLYGTFASSGNTVTILGNQTLTPSYQSTSQINVPIPLSAGQTAGTVSVSNTGGTSNAYPVTISATTSTTPPSATSLTLIPSTNGFPLHAGDLTTVNWNSGGNNSDTVTFYYEGTGGQQPTLIQSFTGSAGDFNWVVPSGITGNWHIRAVSAQSGTFYTNPFVVATPTIPVIVPAPTITGLQGYNSSTGAYSVGSAVSGGTLVVYGNFASTGNTVVVGGQSYTPSYQSTSQINITLGSATGNMSVTVTNANGTSNAQSIIVNAPVVTSPTISAGTNSPVISGVQGYNPTTNVYTTGTAVAGQYLVLYGTFTSTGNTVIVGGSSYTPTYQSTSQLNVSLGSVTGSMLVAVTNANGTSNFQTIVINTPPVVSTPTNSTPGVTTTPSPTTPATQITGVQGYPGYTNGTAVAGQYLVLYGNFTTSGNVVTIGGQSYTPSYQSASQINVPLAGATAGSMTVTVTNANGSASTVVTIIGQTTSMASTNTQMANALSAMQALLQQMSASVTK